jgi:hypothetical protein
MELSMREQLQRRLAELRQEYEAGKAKSRELERQRMELHETMLRISGAIQVLEEELAPSAAQDAPSSAIPLDSARQQRRP